MNKEPTPDFSMQSIFEGIPDDTPGKQELVNEYQQVREERIELDAALDGVTDPNARAQIVDHFFTTRLGLGSTAVEGPNDPPVA